MARLPVPGADAGQWGQILNEYLAEAHNSDGSLKDNVVDSNSIANGSVAETNLAPAVVSKLNTIGGQQGATGPAGPIGATGPAGTSGATGPQGQTGASGATGPAGATGTQGASGATGPQGASGSNGVSGATGATGPQGIAGTDGATGPAGATTISGISGLQSALDAKVPDTRTVAGHGLNGDVTITPADIGAATAAQGTLAASALQPSHVFAPSRRVTGMHTMIIASRSFMGILLPPEASREMLIIRNVGVNPIEAVISSTAVTNYNGTAWTGSTMIQPGEEWVGTTAGQPQIAPTADGIEIRALIWTEAYI